MKLQEYLTHEGIRPVEFARRAGLSAAYVSQLLSGKRGLSLSTAHRIAEVTGGAVTANDFDPVAPQKMSGEAAA